MSALEMRIGPHRQWRLLFAASSYLDDFRKCHAAADLTKRRESERFKRFPVDDLLKDDGLDDIDSLPPPDQIAAEMVENLQAAFGAVPGPGRPEVSIRPRKW